MTLLSITRGAATVAYGTDTFAAHLAAREQRLGLAADTHDTQTPETPCVITQDVTQVNPANQHTAPDVSAPDAAPPMGDMGQQGSRDAWGNVITSARRVGGMMADEMRRIEGGEAA